MTTLERFRTSRFHAHGYHFAITSADEELVAEFNELLVDMRADEPPRDPDSDSATDVIHIDELATDDDGQRWYRVTGPQRVHYERLWEGSMISHTLIAVNHAAAMRCQEHGAVPIHGGAAALDGRAVVLPGHSESGKTTLSTALGTRPGWAYVADEVCRLSPDHLTIAPYGKPVALRRRSVALLADVIDRLGRDGSRLEQDERFVPPSELRGSASAPPSAEQPVALIVFPRVDTEQASKIEPVSPARALELLTQNTLGGTPSTRTLTRWEQQRRVAAFAALDRLVRQAPAYELAMSDLDAACHLVEEAVG
ncbi:MAG: hypothetical protein AAGA42_08665 [Actinomycetota bacterium]